jgi:hypothetical protein
MFWLESEISDDPQFCEYRKGLFSVIPLGLCRMMIMLQALDFGIRFCSQYIPIDCSK